MNCTYPNNNFKWKIACMILLIMHWVMTVIFFLWSKLYLQMKTMTKMTHLWKTQTKKHWTRAGGGRIDFLIGMPPLAPTYKILCRYLFFEGQCACVYLCPALLMCRRNNIKSLDDARRRIKIARFRPYCCFSPNIIDRPTTKLKPNYRPVLLVSYFSHSEFPPSKFPITYIGYY